MPNMMTQTPENAFDQAAVGGNLALMPREEYPFLKRTRDGRIANTVENFSWILMTDPFFNCLRYDELADAPVVVEYALCKATTRRRWVDADDAAAIEHIEATYGLYDRRKYQYAFRQRMRALAYHPVKEELELLRWDGTPRLERFLIDWMGVEDTPYTREASRLIFAGGINRLYEPGCKFDYLIVLIGANQGEGKSTLVRWLALSDQWFGEVTVFDGKEAVEQLQGVWICEVSEMLAFTRTREQEMIKSFLSRPTDRYRRPYAEHIEELPRRCILIGTTNNRSFLVDKTGNRRYVPVEVHMDAEKLYDAEDACKAYIRQCWAEALSLYREGKLPPVADRSLREAFREAQENTMEEDWRVGAIEAYLEEKDPGCYVCVRELKHDALYKNAAEASWEPTRRESLDISQIMDKMPDWERAGVIRFTGYGKQRSWKKRQPSN